MTRRASLNQVLHAVNSAGLRAVKVSVSAAGDIEVLTDAAPTSLDQPLSWVRTKRAPRDQTAGGR